ncbi:S1C family serine protease [Frigidibacter oleivorans]|uniref:S1C family serine protease n=1 Tax=Frigidibacter oleivorans TaxID=2487129 RepID=UPI000F8D2E1C|nr:serine protease [Frigidibacter oleivorans]
MFRRPLRALTLVCLAAPQALAQTPLGSPVGAAPDPGALVALGTPIRPGADLAPVIAPDDTTHSAQPPVSATGTGFAVTAEGHVLTNQHVIDGCAGIRVDGRQAELVAEDPVLDLALLRGAAAGPVARFAPRPAPLNSDVTVAGFPLAGLLDGLNVTRGAVTGLTGLGANRDEMQISAPVQPGNSGGPALNARGEVVGVVVAKLDAQLVAAELGDIPQNVNFAIRGEAAQHFLAQNGVMPQVGGAVEPLPPEALAELAAAITLFVECEAGPG